MVVDTQFPSQVTLSKSLSLFGQGLTEIEIHFLQIKFTAIGVYLDPEISSHLQQWKGKKSNELAADDAFFDAVISAPVEKYIKIVVIKEIKGSQYGSQLETFLRDRLAEIDKYEEEEEAALEEIVQFFQSKYFKTDSFFSFHFPASSPGVVEIKFTASEEGGEKESAPLKVENGNVVEMIQKWYLGGSCGISPTTIASVAENLAAELSK